MKTKNVLLILLLFILSAQIKAQDNPSSDMQSLDKATAFIRDAFAKGDAELVAKLHAPNVVKYFGGNNVVTGRDELEKQLKGWFQNTKIEFVENTVESTVFNGGTAVQTVIFAIKSTPKSGGEPTISRGRSMVVYIRSKDSPLVG